MQRPRDSWLRAGGMEGRLCGGRARRGDVVPAGAGEMCRAPLGGHRLQWCAVAGSYQLLRADCDIAGNFVNQFLNCC